MSAGTPNVPKKHVYQIVTYGRPSSGKTCLLAALAMPRGAHPEGFDAIWVHDETTIPKPPGDPTSWDQQDPKVARFLGRERLPAAIREIEAGKLPPATAVDIPYRFLFDFTTPDGCIRRVEMVDYSGELVNPDITEGDFAKQLIKHMESADAILVLAEATATDEQSERVRRDLHKLREALALVSEKRRRSRSEPFPVGLVYDKWDRWSRMEKFSSPEAKIELDEFLGQKPPPPHVTLRNVLMAVAGEPEYFREFVASAFGKAQKVMLDTGNGPREVEVPASVSPLPSYGLEDPFVEVCRAADNLELNRLMRETAQLAPWKVWQLKDRAGSKLASEASAYARRFPRHMPQHKTALEIAAQATRQFSQQLVVVSCTVAALLMFSLQGAVVAYDEAMFAAHNPAITKPFNPNDFSDMQATLPKWKQAEEYLGAYQTRTWYRWASHWRHSPQWAAKQRLAVLERIGPAADMVGTYGKFKSELEGIQTRLADVTTAVEVDKLLEAIAGYQIPAGFPELEVLKATVGESLKKRIGELQGVEAYAAFRHEIDKFLESGNISEAANLLAKSGDQYPAQIETLRTNFRQGAPDLIRKRVLTLCEPLDKSANNWTGAANYLERLEANEAFLDLMGRDFRGKLTRARDWVARHQQLTRYRQWYDDKADLSKANLARLAGYREIVDRYDQFVNDTQRKRDWTIKVDRLYFQHDGAAATTNAKIYTYCDGQYAGTVSPFIGRGDFKDAEGSGSVTISGQSLNSIFSFSTKVVPTNWIGFGDDAGVSGNVQTSIAALAANPKVLNCGMSGFAIKCDVYISVDPASLPVLGNIPLPTPPSELTLR
jgi:hypothetical protein